MHPPFLAFVPFFLFVKANNLLTIKLNARLKNVKVVKKFVGNDALAQVIVKEYDEKVMLPLFL